LSKKITTENTEKIVFKALSGQLAYGALLVSSEPLGLVFDPEAQTRRELVAERLNVEDCDLCGFISHLVLLKTFYGTYHDTSCRYS
jgi:hypothetical protein